MKNKFGALFAILLAASCSFPARTEAMTTPYVVLKIAAPLGADFAALTKAQAAKLGIAGGVVVVKIYAGGVLSSQTKMSQGFIITKIGNIPVASVAQLHAALRQQKVSFQIEGVYPGHKDAVYYTIHDF